MDRLLIGSQALRYWFPTQRTPRDWDWFSPTPMSGGETFWHPALEAYEPEGEIATPDELYTIKISHSFWNLHGTWRKHINDALFLKRNGAEFQPAFYDTL